MARNKYTIQSGDNYFRLAERMYGDQRYADVLISANGGAPLHPGMVITIPNVDTRQGPGTFDQQAAVAAAALDAVNTSEEFQRSGSVFNPWYDPNDPNNSNPFINGGATVAGANVREAEAQSEGPIAPAADEALTSPVGRDAEAQSAESERLQALADYYGEGNTVPTASQGVIPTASQSNASDVERTVQPYQGALSQLTGGTPSGPEHAAILNARQVIREQQRLAAEQQAQRLAVEAAGDPTFSERSTLDVSTRQGRASSRLPRDAQYLSGPRADASLTTNRGPGLADTLFADERDPALPSSQEQASYVTPGYLEESQRQHEEAQRGAWASRYTGLAGHYAVNEASLLRQRQAETQRLTGLAYFWQDLRDRFGQGEQLGDYWLEQMERIGWIAPPDDGAGHSGLNPYDFINFEPRLIEGAGDTGGGGGGGGGYGGYASRVFPRQPAPYFSNRGGDLNNTMVRYRAASSPRQQQFRELQREQGAPSGFGLIVFREG